MPHCQPEYIKVESGVVRMFQVEYEPYRHWMFPESLWTREEVRRYMKTGEYSEKVKKLIRGGK